MALFFFCGCQPCRECALAWGQAQAGFASDGAAPLTLVVFSGDAPAARTFAAEAGLNAAQTVLLADEDDRVTDRYHVTQCPRVFVLDAAGRVCDTNPDPNAPAIAIASGAVTALRRLARISPTRRRR